MVNKLHKIILTLSSVILFMQCDLYKTGSMGPISPVNVKEKIWKLHKDFFNERKILYNGFSDGSALYICGLYYFPVIDSSGYCTFYFNHGRMSAFSKPVFSKTYNASCLSDERTLFFRENESPFTDLIISLQDIDSTFSDKAEICNQHYSDFMGAYNDQDIFLTVINTGGIMYLLFIELERGGSVLDLKIKDSRKVSFIYDVYYNVIMSLGDDFFVSSSDAGYKISSTGEFRKVIDQVIFETYNYNDTLIAIGPYELYKSTDTGETWERIADNWPFCNATFFQIENQLCFYVTDQIWTINLGTGIMREIDNQGLATNEITSVSAFCRKVYVTTLSGLFYKDMEDFFTYVK
jgi:hypothetical protein